MIDRKLWLVTSSKKYKNHLYKTWSNMLYRCYHRPSTYNKNAKYYYNKNIKVCEEWRYDFWNFYYWAKRNGYRKNLTIDRIDSNKDYSPQNCRWVTTETQSNNLSNTIRIKDPIELCENTKTITQLSQQYNIPRGTLQNWYYRYKKGKLTEKEWKTRFAWLVKKYKDR